MPFSRFPLLERIRLDASVEFFQAPPLRATVFVRNSSRETIPAGTVVHFQYHVPLVTGSVLVKGTLELADDLRSAQEARESRDHWKLPVGVLFFGLPDEAEAEAWYHRARVARQSLWEAARPLPTRSMNRPTRGARLSSPRPVSADLP